MNKIIKNIALVSALVLATVACTKEQNPYEPAPAPVGEQVYFSKSLSQQINLDNNATSFDIAVYRGTDNLEAIDVAIEASGDGVDVFDIPGVVSFQNGQAESKITISYDPEVIGANVYWPVTIKISDEGLTSLYGLSEISFSAGIALPWLVFDTGTLIESPEWWGEVEEGKTLYYQQLSETIRYCRIPGCFGYETIKGGDPYDVQDYCFYWNTETNQVYIPKQYMGYTNSNGPTFFLDESEFYNWYWSADKGGQNAVGTAAWFEFCDKFRAKYPEDYYPYYDGNGGFYLADHYSAGEPGAASFLGFYVQAGAPDSFICKSFVRADYTIDGEYGGMFVDPSNVPSPIFNFYAETADPVGVKFIVISPDDDVMASFAALLDGSAEGIQDAVFSEGEASAKVEGVEPGQIVVIVAPYGEDGTLQADYAILIEAYFPGVNAEVHELEAKVQAVPISLVYPAQVLEQVGAGDWNALCCGIIGNDIKSAVILLAKASVIDGLGDDLLDTVLEYGEAFDAEDIAAINSENGLVAPYLELPSDTEFAFAVALQNIYGTKDCLVAYGATTPEPEAVFAASGVTSFYSDYVESSKYEINLSEGWSKPSGKLNAKNIKNSTVFMNFEK